MRHPDEPPTKPTLPPGAGMPAPSLADPGATNGGAAAPPAGPARYVLGAEIARGGMGVVYRAVDTVLGREVAVKALQDRYVHNSGTAARFEDEARIAGGLQHPGIPPVHDFGRLPDGRPFLAMKLIKGQTLDALLAARPDPGAERGRYVAAFEQVCQALAYAHAHGVIHRDLKPANVMVGAFGEVQVMDWGLAKVLGGAPAPAGGAEETSSGTVVASLRDSDRSFTQAGSVLGTPAFMAPEQAAGAVGLIDRRSDVFGLGGVLAAVLTGLPPFHGDTAEEARQQAALGKVQGCFNRLDGCGADPELVALCKRCLAPEKDDRPADAGEVARAVAELRSAAEERARQAEFDRVKAEGEKAAAQLQMAEQRKRRRVQAALGVSFTALVVLAVAFAWWVDNQRRARREAAAREVRQAIEAAVARYSLAKGANNDLALWAEARAAALQAQERASTAPADVRELTAALLAEIEWVEKNRRLVAALLAIQASMGDTVGNDTRQDFHGANARYEQAFRDYGADLGRLPPHEAADLFRKIGAGSTVQLAAALDDWAYVCFVIRVWARVNPDPMWKAGLAAAARLFQVTRLLDPDPFRNRIREAVLAQDAAGLKRLAETCDPATQPVQTVNLISVWQFWITNDVPGAVRFLYRAHPHHPGDFQINHNIAYFHNEQKQHADAVPHSLAAIAVRPRSSAAWLDYAMAMEGLGRHEEAAAGYRRVADLSPLTWAFRIKAAAALARLGRLEEACLETRKALRLSPQNQLIIASLARTELMRKLLPRLPGVLAGTDRPTSPAEAVGLADLCNQPFQKRFAAAARLYGEALAADAELADDPTAMHRYFAACAAARAACGDGVDAPTDPAARALLRAKALAWLRAELALRKKQAALPAAAERRAAADALSHWLADAALSGVRPGAKHAGLPDAERAAWSALWADVLVTLDAARRPPNSAPMPKS